jgi:hypothetical protein
MDLWGESGNASAFPAGWSNLLTRDSKIVFRPARVGNHKVAAFCNWL